MNALLDGVTGISAILFVLGFVLLGIEMLNPGISVPGVMGVISLGAATIMSADSIQEGLVFIIIIIVILVIMFAGAVTILSKGKLKSSVILKEEQDKSYQSINDMSYLKGSQGTVVTDLKPCGKGLFGKKEYDVIAEGKYIQVGSKIEVYEIKDSQIIVKEI